MKGNFRRKITAILMIFLLLSTFSSCVSEKENSYSDFTTDYFDTITQISCYAENETKGNEFLSLAFSELERYHQLFDRYNSYENVRNIYTLNHSAWENPIEVEPDLIELLLLGKEAYVLSNGEVNIAFGAVLEIWHERRVNFQSEVQDVSLPSLEELQEANLHTNLNDIVIDEAKNTVFLADEKLKIDVGAIAKGFVGEKIADTLKAAGLKSGFVNIGGNVTVIGQKPDGSDWIIAVDSHEENASEPYICSLKLSNGTVTNSGGAERYFVVDGISYNHIIDKDTLFPSNLYRQVCVISQNTYLGDALSTAFFNMDLSDGLALCESLENVEAMWIMNDGGEVVSAGFEKYRKN